MRKAARFFIIPVITAACALQSAAPVGPLVAVIGAATPVCAAEEWQVEFEALCRKTQDPSLFTVDELRLLITQCDRLIARLEKLEEHVRKVPLIRLKMARKLFAFTLESKESSAR